MAPVFFVSYARGDVEHPEFREIFVGFVKDLRQRVSNKLPDVEADDVEFSDPDIHTGEDWTDRLWTEISHCKVGVVLFSPRYFTRRWCGREFQVLLQRARRGSGPTGIIPVRWEKLNGEPPKCAARFQSNEGEFPSEYASRGMRALVRVRAVSLLAHEDTMEVLASRIAAAAEPQRLQPLPPDFDLENVPSAWEAAATADPESHKEGSISKTCFVFLSKTGSDWIPYQDAAEKIGAFAQKITGELGLSYEELPCDGMLARKLADTSKSNVPTVLFGDPASLDAAPFASSLEEYDGRFLPNCAALVPWEPDKRGAINDDARWARLRKLNKVKSPPPFHEWRSIFSHEELDKKTRTHIEQIRSQLLKQVVSDPESTVAVAKAEDTTLQQNAATQGIDTQTPPQLGSGR
jgi:hypothetical protein